MTIESKHVSKSVSAWGGLILLVPIAANLFGVEFSQTEVQQIGQAAQHAEQFYLNLMALIGAIQLVVGRLNAKRPLHFIPGAPFEVDMKTGKKITKPVAIPPDVQKRMDEQDGNAELF